MTGYIVPAYVALDTATDALASRDRRFLRRAEPGDSAPRSAPPSTATIRAWADVDFLRFGPMAQDGRYERFAFFPDVHGTGARQIRGFLVSQDEKLLKPGALAGQSAAVQGLPALESLLFSGKAALLQPAPPEPFRCALAVAVAKNMQTIADDALAGWQGEKSWAALIETPGAGQSRLPHARGGDDGDSEGDPHRPRAGARPPARAGARQDAGGREGEPRALQRLRRGARLSRRLGRRAAAFRRRVGHSRPPAGRRSRATAIRSASSSPT